MRYPGLSHFSQTEISYPAMGIGRKPNRGPTAFGCDFVEACEELGVL
ncbi:hypothetical protein, partial [Nocardia concava]